MNQILSDGVWFNQPIRLKCNSYSDFQVTELPEQQPVAVITGASRGIGEASARTLAAAGYHVVLCARTRDRINDIAEQLRENGHSATAIECDVADRASTDALMNTVAASWDRLDVLVNNAGRLHTARRAERLGYQEWDLTVETNLTAPWALAVRAKALMPRGGTVVNVASTASYYPSTGLSAYDVSKAGMLMLTRVLALEWAASGIRVVGVAPGKVDTDLLAPIKALTESGKLGLNPQGRFGTPDEVAGLIEFLVSPAAAYITGVTIPIDGGELLVATSELGK
jgi:NAD(P)-dependent dehydrogenase (short-subunit alcohol dehydrogenase family)